MKDIKIKVLLSLLLLFFTLIFNSCSEEVDNSNMFINHEESIMGYLNSNPDYSDFAALLHNVTLSKRDNASNLASVLDARGNYTCFIPDNKAMRSFLKQPLDAAIDLSLINDSVAQQITKSCIIDNGDEVAYTVADFPTKGAFSKSNLNNRILMVNLDEVTGKYIINSTSSIIKAELQVTNGYIHFVDNVISPTTNCIPTLMKNFSNMHIMAKLIEETGWYKELTQYRDEDYENKEKEERGGGLYGPTFPIPQHRYIGFTALVEPDSLLNAVWGIEKPIMDEESGDIKNWDNILKALKEKCEEFYDNNSEDLKNEDNAVNQFVAYHFIQGAHAYNNLVFHFNEYGYSWGDPHNPQTKKLSVDLTDFFITLGRRKRLLKITHVAEDPEHPMIINRKALYKNGLWDDYTVKAVIDIPPYHSNVKMFEKNGSEDNNSLNGFIFPINRILVYDDFTKNNVLNERLRIEVCNILPEMSSSQLRNTWYWYLPNGYFDNIINETEETEINYIDEAHYSPGSWWIDYEGDEFLFSGIFDFTIRLPHIPVAGTYELRMGCSNTNVNRGMAQIYFGDNPNALAATGLPIDMRQGGSADNINIPWIADQDDNILNIENDKNLRNHNYMKAPKIFTSCSGTGTYPARDNNRVLRYIITRNQMDPNKTYYVRFKSALDKTDSQFFVDYFELVPKTIYANEASPEDVW